MKSMKSIISLTHSCNCVDSLEPRSRRADMRHSAIAIATVSALALGLAANPALADTVKVGVVLPFSGGVADIAQTELRGMKLYLKLHKAELGKHEIQLIERDSKEP